MGFSTSKKTHPPKRKHCWNMTGGPQVLDGGIMEEGRPRNYGDCRSHGTLTSPGLMRLSRRCASIIFNHHHLGHHLYHILCITIILLIQILLIFLFITIIYISIITCADTVETVLRTSQPPLSSRRLNSLRCNRCCQSLPT